MNKTFKIALVFVAVVAVALFAQSGAWAGKMQSGNEAPSVAVSNAGVRLESTVVDQGSTTGDDGGLTTTNQTQKFKLPAAARAGCPDGSVFTLSGGGEGGLSVAIGVGPNWNKPIYYFLNGTWYTIYGTRGDDGVLRVTFPTGTEYFVVPPA